MDVGIIIAVLSLVISIVSLLFTYSQVRVATKTAKAEIAITLIDQLYSDATVRLLLRKVYYKELSLRTREAGFVDVVFFDGNATVTATDDIDVLLNRFQIIGHLFGIGILKFRDLQGIRYEIIRLGRDEAIRGYLDFLGSDFQRISGVRHDHFGYFKGLYNAFEYDPKFMRP